MATSPSLLQYLGDLKSKNTKTETILLVDGSGSISPDDFDLLKLFMKNFAKTFGVNENRRLGILQFSGNVKLEIAPTSNPVDFANAVDAMKQLRGGTGTHLALHDAPFHMACPDYRSVIILLTDGEADSPNLTRKEANILADVKGLEVICIGVGPSVNHNELAHIATQPSLNRCFYLKDMATLFKMFQDADVDLAPPIVTVTLRRIDEINLAVTSPSDATVSYEIEYWPLVNPKEEKWTKKLSKTDTKTFTFVGGLFPKTVYVLQVRASTKNGQWSSFSPRMQVETQSNVGIISQLSTSEKMLQHKKALQQSIQAFNLRQALMSRGYKQEDLDKFGITPECPVSILFTGCAGVGKSTILNSMIALFDRLADPTSDNQSCFSVVRDVGGKSIVEAASVSTSYYQWQCRLNKNIRLCDVWGMTEKYKHHKSLYKYILSGKISNNFSYAEDIDQALEQHIGVFDLAKVQISEMVHCVAIVISSDCVEQTMDGSWSQPVKDSIIISKMVSKDQHAAWLKRNPLFIFSKADLLDSRVKSNYELLHLSDEIKNTTKELGLALGQTEHGLLPFTTYQNQNDTLDDYKDFYLLHLLEKCLKASVDNIVAIMDSGLPVTAETPKTPRLSSTSDSPNNNSKVDPLPLFFTPPKLKENARISVYKDKVSIGFVVSDPSLKTLTNFRKVMNDDEVGELSNKFQFFDVKSNSPIPLEKEDSVLVESILTVVTEDEDKKDAIIVADKLTTKIGIRDFETQKSYGVLVDCDQNMLLSLARKEVSSEIEENLSTKANFKFYTATKDPISPKAEEKLKLIDCIRKDDSMFILIKVIKN